MNVYRNCVKFVFVLLGNLLTYFEKRGKQYRCLVEVAATL